VPVQELARRGAPAAHGRAGAGGCHCQLVPHHVTLLPPQVCSPASYLAPGRPLSHFNFLSKTFVCVLVSRPGDKVRVRECPSFCKSARWNYKWHLNGTENFEVFQFADSLHRVLLIY
jgi:hypothetical protein